MSRFSKLGSVGVACTIAAVLSIALAPAAASAKNGPSGPGSMGVSKVHVSNVGGLQVNKNIGKLPITKNVGDPMLKKIGKIGSDPISKTPISKIGVDPLSKTPKKKPMINPIDPAFCHHNFFCNPHCHWLFFPLIVERVQVECFYGEPLYTLYYETGDGVKVFSQYELPTESPTLDKTEHALDKSNTGWWLVNAAGQLVDTNTGDKAAIVQATAAE